MVFCSEAMQEIGQAIHAGAHRGSCAEGSAILEQGSKAYPTSMCLVIALKGFEY